MATTVIITSVTLNVDHDPADIIALAERILRDLPAKIDPLIAGTLTDAEKYALGMYSNRADTVILRTGDAALLHLALLARCLATRDDADDRDVMIMLALPHVLAQRLRLSPAVVFGEVADRLPEGWLTELLREFGERQDITLKAFGWQEVSTPEGPDFRPLPY